MTTLDEFDCRRYARHLKQRARDGELKAGTATTYCAVRAFLSFCVADAFHDTGWLAIGRALDETGTPEDDPTYVPPSLLPTHYGRFGTTGSDKSKALINDALSLYEYTDGPVVLVDPKDDGLPENYMRSHAARFGVDDMEQNVVHFSIPDILPGFSFFALQPALDNGPSRIDAIQRTADHYEEILKLTMGSAKCGSATVAPTFIRTLISALFDAEHGRDNGTCADSTARTRTTSLTAGSNTRSTSCGRPARPSHSPNTPPLVGPGRPAAGRSATPVGPDRVQPSNEWGE